MTETCKYDELRLKTERQLHQLISHELDLGIREAQQALSCDTWALAERHSLRARRAHSTASHLILLVDEVSSGERDRWQATLERLYEMLDGLTILASQSTPTAENIASLAHALWDARGSPQGSPEDDWFRAERTLKSQRASQAVCC